MKAPDINNQQKATELFMQPSESDLAFVENVNLYDLSDRILLVAEALESFSNIFDEIIVPDYLFNK